MATLSPQDGVSQDSLPAGTYGFIGLGNMGFGMAKNVRTKIPSTVRLVICDISQDRVDQFLKDSAAAVEEAKTPKELAEKADVIITSLPNGSVVQKVFTDPDTGILAASKSDKRKLFLETSSIEFNISSQVRNLVEASGVGDMIDAPVSGGIPSAHAGTLTIMVGATPSLFAKAKSLLGLMGKEDAIYYCGDPGAGLATMNAGVRYGLDPKRLAEVISVSTGVSWHTISRNPVKGVCPDAPSARDFEGGFPTEGASGVLNMAVDLMESIGVQHNFGTLMRTIYARALKSDKCLGKEHSSIYRIFQEDPVPEEK